MKIIFEQFLIKTNILEIIFEEWQYTKNCKANQDSKMTVEEHSLKTLKKFQEVVLNLDSYYPKWSRHIKNEKKCEWWFYFSVLFHDIGKPKTAITEEQKITYPKHAQIGFSLIDKNLQELRFSNEEKKGIEQTISGHLRVSQISNNNQNPTKKAMNRFFKTFKENSIFMILLDFSDANAYPEKIKKQISENDQFKENLNNQNVFSEKKFKRTAMDYIRHANFKTFIDYQSFKDQQSEDPSSRVILLTTKSKRNYLGGYWRRPIHLFEQPHQKE